MKLFDKVKVINDKEYYNKNFVFKGMVGTIIDAEIRHNSFNVAFTDERNQNPEIFTNEEDFKNLNEDILCFIEIKDLELLEESEISDEYILKNLPEKYPDMWCKVENGYITNLKGEKKNKTAYDYSS